MVNDADPSLPKPLTDDICNFFGLAIVAQVIQWLMEGMTVPKKTLVHRADIMLTGAVQNAIHNAQTLG